MKKISAHQLIEEFYWLYRFIDLILPFIILLLSMLIYGINWQERYLILGVVGGLIFTTSAQLIGVYRISVSRKLIHSLQLIINAWLVTWVILIVLAFLLKDSANFSRGTLLIWAALTPLALLLYRPILLAVFKKFSVNKNRQRTIAIAGSSITKSQLAAVTDSNYYSIKISGYYNDSPSTDIDLEFNGTLDRIYKDALENKFDEVYICLPLHEEQKIKKLIDELSDTTLSVKYIPNLFMFDLMHTKWFDINGTPVLSVYDTPLNSLSSRLLKRTEDVAISILILVAISPILLLIALTIKLTSPGPVIFKQKRYGLNGKEINVYKFRSMTTQDNGNHIKQATKNDTRITRLGAILRRTSLDELPQFVNVIQGKMSIVGPRPHATFHNEQYRKLVPKYMQRHLVKPGITGWAQVNGWRGETDTLEKMEKRVEFDLHYINNWSIWLDIKIIILTIFKGFINKNAY